MNTTVYSGYGGRVHNLGLMNDRTAVIICGGFLFLSGVILGVTRKKENNEDAKTIATVKAPSKYAIEWPKWDGVWKDGRFDLGEFTENFDQLLEALRQRVR